MTSRRCVWRHRRHCAAADGWHVVSATARDRHASSWSTFWSEKAGTRTASCILMHVLCNVHLTTVTCNGGSLLWSNEGCLHYYISLSLDEHWAIYELNFCQTWQHNELHYLMIDIISVPYVCIWCTIDITHTLLRKITLHVDNKNRTVARH